MKCSLHLRHRIHHALVIGRERIELEVDDAGNIKKMELQKITQDIKMVLIRVWINYFQDCLNSNSVDEEKKISLPSKPLCDSLQTHVKA